MTRFAAPFLVAMVVLGCGTAAPSAELECVHDTVTRIHDAGAKRCFIAGPDHGCRGASR